MATAANDVQTLFNHHARGWRRKYGPKGKLNWRVEQFAGRLFELCVPPGHILDLGCGTGEIAAALDQRGYHVTACDVAENMLAIARRSHPGAAVEWTGLAPDWDTLPFADRSFDAVVASSVFEYLDDVPRVATELSRVLRPEGVLLLSVPNPCNAVRKFEARLQALVVSHGVPPLLRRFPRLDRYMPPTTYHLPAFRSLLRHVPRLDRYAAYLRLSRNRWDAPGWRSVLSAAHFSPCDERDFSRAAWREQAQAPLVLLALKRAG